MKRVSQWILLGLIAVGLVGCESAYYGAWEKVGVHKREILVDRIEDAQEAQQDTQQQFQDALEQYRSVVSFDGGNLEKLYNQLNTEYQDSQQAAADIRQRIDAVDNVANDLFKEWQKELELYADQNLRRNSARQLQDTRNRYSRLKVSMEKAERSVHPVLDKFRDQVLYLKHNLNARAINALKGELSTIDTDVSRLVREMQNSIDEASQFIQALR